MVPARPDADVARREPRWPLLLVVAAGLAAWWGVSRCEFVFDDKPAIVDNQALQAFDWWQAAFRPEHQPLANRPFACAALAFDLWCFGPGPFGPHLGNLLLHLGNAVLVLLVVRAALQAPSLAGGFDPARCTRVATAAAVLWVVHPLGGEAVAYATQRSTLLFSGCLLVALWSALRAANSATPVRWRSLAVLAVALGMASKEDMVLAPVLLLLWQRALLVPSWAAMRAHAGYLAALGATWIVLFWCVALGADNVTVGYGARTDVTAWQWLLTQSGVLVRYLGLVVWPHPLRGVYDVDIVNDLANAILPGTVVLGLFGGSIWLLRRRPWWALPGALFFLLLAATSSVLPIVTEVAAERRMYLPMLAVIVPLVIAAERALRGAAFAAAVAALAIGGSVLARERVAVYTDNFALFTDAYDKRDPTSRSFMAGRLLGDYSTALWKRQRFDEAAPVLDRMMECKGLGPEQIHKYVQSLVQRGRPDDAVIVLRRELGAGHAEPRLLFGALGACLLQLVVNSGANADDARLAEAEVALRRALELDSSDASFWNSLGGVMRARGRLADAEHAYRRSIELTTERSLPYMMLADLLGQLGRGAEVGPLFDRLLQARPRDVKVRFELLDFLMKRGQVAPARLLMEDVLRIEPGHPQAVQVLQQLQGR